MRLANFRETQKIGNDELAAPVLVDPVGMQAVAAASRFQVDQGKRQIIMAQEPGEYVQSLGLPFRVAVRLPGRQASRDRRGGFQGLLIEQARSGCACRQSLVCRRDGKHPTARFAGSQASAGISTRHLYRQACGRNSRQEQGLRQPGIVISQTFLEPDPVSVSTDARQEISLSASDAEAAPQEHCPGMQLQ